MLLKGKTLGKSGKQNTVINYTKVKKEELVKGYVRYFSTFD